MKTNEKDQELLKLYLENECKLEEVSNRIDVTMEDPLAGILKPIVRKEVDFEHFNPSNFVNYLAKLCQYKYEELFNFDGYSKNEKETLIYLASLVTLDDFFDSVALIGALLNEEEIKEFQRTFKEVAMVLYSLIGHTSGGNLLIIEEYISKKKGEEFSFVLNNLDSWIRLKNLKENLDKELESYSYLKK